jgi:hypothetical protein
MNLVELRHMLGWCAVINYLILVLWFLVFTLARDPLYRLHSKWFRLSEERFDALNYAGMSVMKIGVLLLNVAPYLALRIMM